MKSDAIPNHPNHSKSLANPHEMILVSPFFLVPNATPDLVESRDCRGGGHQASGHGTFLAGYPLTKTVEKP
jgi:hypothetical protein